MKTLCSLKNIFSQLLRNNYEHKCLFIAVTDCELFAPEQYVETYRVANHAGKRYFCLLFFCNNNFTF